MRELVLGMATGYKWITVAAFVHSLWKSGYQGDLVLFVNSDNRDLDRNVERYGWRVIRIKTVYPYDPSLADQDVDGEFFDGAAPHVRRYKLYQMFLNQNFDKYEHFMLTDVKDVLFQRPPFDFDTGGADLCVFEEERSRRVRDCALNSNWVTRAYGREELDRIQDHPILCSGTTIGTNRGVREYCDFMVESMRKHAITWNGGDQGAHNVLVRNGQVANSRVFGNEDGPVLTMAFRKEKPKMNASGFVLSGSGQIPNVLHQYDRSPQLIRWAASRYLSLPQRVKVRISLLKRRLVKP